MKKEDKAKQIISYLCIGDENWLEYDPSLKGYIGFRVTGLEQVIKIPTFFSVTRGYEEVAKHVTNAGFDYGRCSEVVSDYQKQLVAFQESAKAHQESFNEFRKEFSEVLEDLIQRRSRELLK